MDIKTGGFNAAQMLASLSRAQQRQLLEALLIQGKGSQGSAQFSAALTAAEEWLARRAKEAFSPVHAHARYRMWFIFMLLRYGALRLPEIFSLKADNFDPDRRLVRITCKRPRVIPLPEEAGNRLAAMWQEWPGRLAADYPFLCDASLVRRMLKQCAIACQIQAEELTAGKLRRHRAMELEAGGLHPALAAAFLGLKRDNSLFSQADSFSVIRKFVQERTAMKTSARNIFRGRVTSLKSHGILAEVTLTTPQGLKVTSIITETSKKNLALEEGKHIVALIKAPWVSVLPIGWEQGHENQYKGKVMSMQKDALACEIIIHLPEGTQLCALYANGSTPDAAIRTGAEVNASFSAFSVIITED